jgi:molecular chaperone GrpE
MAWLFVVMLLIALGVSTYLLVQARNEAEARREAVEREHRRTLEELADEHSARLERLERESKRERARAHLKLAREMLPALDALRAARDNVGPDDELGRGLELVDRAMHDAMAAHGVERITPDDSTRFDPEIHEAVDIVETDDVPARHVADCLRDGYRFGDAYVLRPAMVRVARAPADEPADRSGEVVLDFDDEAREPDAAHELEEEELEESAPVASES